MPNRLETAGIGQEAEDVHGQHEEEDAPDVLDEAIRVFVQRRLGDFLPKVIAHGLEHVGEPAGTMASTPPCPRRRLTIIGTTAISSRPARAIIAI